MDNLLAEKPTHSFYGKNKCRLPPVDPTMSDGSDTSDDEEPLSKYIQKTVPLPLSGKIRFYTFVEYNLVINLLQMTVILMVV